MKKNDLNRLMGCLAMSAAVASPPLLAGENPFQLKEFGAPSVLAEVVPPASPKAEAAPQKGSEGMCGGMMKMMDGNGDGKVSKDEFMKHHEGMFAMMDKNNDGVLDESEMGQMRMMMQHMMGGGMGGMMHGGGMGGGGMEGMKHETPKP